MINQPQNIFLQIGEDNDEPDFLNLREVSWCDHRVNPNDLEYVSEKQANSDFIKNLIRVIDSSELSPWAAEQEKPAKAFEMGQELMRNRLLVLLHQEFIDTI